MILKRIIVSSLSLILFLIISATAYGQLGTTGINGVVKDQLGAVIGGATIRATNRSTGEMRETTSSEDGRYTITNLPPGNYAIIIEADGFSKAGVDDALITVGSIVTVAVKLTPKGNDDVIEVVADHANPVNLTTSDVSGVINDRAVANLPLNGRNFLDLALLLPGTAPTVTFDVLKIGTSQITTVGQTARGGNITVDSGDNNDDLFGVPLQNFPIESVREFQIAQNGYSAEYGRAAGGVINVVTKSGTNELHGSGSFFFRNDKLSGLPATLDRNLINRVGEPPFDREQYAFSIGGPLKKDRAWFFSSYEYRFQDAISIVGIRDLTARQIVLGYTPTPLRNPLYLARVDAQVTPNDRMTFRFALERSNNTTTTLGVVGLQTANSKIRSLNRYYSGVYTWLHIFSTRVVNEFTFHQNNSSNTIPQTSQQVQLVFPSIQDGNDTAAPQATSQRRSQLRDNVSLLLGKHSVKFGGEFHQINSEFLVDVFKNGVLFLKENFATIDRNQDGKIDDNDIRLDESDKNFGSPNVNTPNQYISAYIQDNWKVHKNLSINLGLRYELDTNATNTKDFDANSPAIKALGQARIDKNNFAPRIGFNWDIFGNGHTSLRGSYGIYYNRNLLFFANSGVASGVDTRFEVRAGSKVDADGHFLPGTPTLANPFSGKILFIESTTLSGPDPNLATPYVQQMNLGIQHELAKDLVVSVEGVHNFGLKFTENRFFNINGNDLFLFVGPLKNWYDALFVKVEKRPSKRYSFIASYTFSKSLNLSNDDISTEFNSLATQEAKKGPPINDLRHRFTFSGIVDLPLGFQFSSILTLESSPPITIFVSGVGRLPFAQRGAGARQFKNGRELNAFISEINKGRNVPIPFVRDDVKIGNNFASMDIRLTKLVKFNERFGLQGLIEVFNLFNRTNVRGPGANTFPGIDNSIVRDSGNRNDPGFLRASNFGAKRQTAGGVFGTGGPRAVQFAVRFQF